MTNYTDQERRSVSQAVRLAITRRGLKQEDVARILGVRTQTVRNRLSKADFTEKVAKNWSVALGIPYDCFFPQKESDDPRVLLRALSKEVTALKRRVAALEKKCEK